MAESDKRPDTSLHGGMTTKSPSAVEPKPEGGSVNSEPTRTGVGAPAPTLGPRSA